MRVMRKPVLIIRQETELFCTFFFFFFWGGGGGSAVNEGVEYKLNIVERAFITQGGVYFRGGVNVITHGSYFAEISTLQGWLLCLPCRNVCFRVIFELQEKLRELSSLLQRCLALERNPSLSGIVLEGVSCLDTSVSLTGKLG